MIIETKENFIKKLKLNSNINRFIFAKTLFAMVLNPSEKFLVMLANTVMNRFVYESEICDGVSNIVDILTSFDCWKNLKFMDEIDVSSPCFQTCLKIASDVLSGKLDEKFSSVLFFHKKSENHLLTNKIKPKFVENGFSFFDVYI